MCHFYWIFLDNWDFISFFIQIHIRKNKNRGECILDNLRTRLIAVEYLHEFLHGNKILLEDAFVLNDGWTHHLRRGIENRRLIQEGCASCLRASGLLGRWSNLLAIFLIFGRGFIEHALVNVFNRIREGLVRSKHLDERHIAQQLTRQPSLLFARIHRSRSIPTANRSVRTVRYGSSDSIWVEAWRSLWFARACRSGAGWDCVSP